MDTTCHGCAGFQFLLPLAGQKSTFLCALHARNAVFFEGLIGRAVVAFKVAIKDLIELSMDLEPPRWLFPLLFPDWRKARNTAPDIVMFHLPTSTAFAIV